MANDLSEAIEVATTTDNKGATSEISCSASYNVDNLLRRYT